MSPNGRKRRPHDQRRLFVARMVASARSGEPNGRRTSFWAQIWTTDSSWASVVTERPGNAQILTTDGQNASVVKNRTLETGALSVEQGQRAIRAPAAPHPPS